MNYLLRLVGVVTFIITVQAANAAIKVTKVEPPNWWVGMKWDTLQIMVYGKDLNGITAESSSPDVAVLGVENTENPAYAFINVVISHTAAPKNYTLTLKRGREKTRLEYPVLQRPEPERRYQGFTPADVIYLITPDRFADGDTTNNLIRGMRDAYNPDSLIGRHGGDIQGMIDHLDYVRDLGVTALWVNPLVENNTNISYHGYAATDLYRIDPRFGTNELYKNFVAEAHARGLKVILDHVSNHISIDHPWMASLPAADWLNGSVKDHQSNRHWKSTLPDPYSDSLVRSNTTHGWFARYMPDLNQNNPLLSRYLIQNTLWWIETTGLDGIREDTYSYADPEFLARWAEAVKEEYPAFNIVGEVWIYDPVYLASYQSGSALSPIDSHLPSVTDFALFQQFMRVFGNEKTDIWAFHELFTKDFIYPDPANLVTFLDNHDVARIMYICKNDVKRFKLALTLLLTMRGIPQLYYGTEIGMVGGTDHGEIRSEFPGGFPHRKSRNAFTREGRTFDENNIYDFLSGLLTLRKSHPALTGGTLVHFPPQNNVYMYLRTAGDETLLIVANNGNETKTIDVRDAGSYLAPHLINAVAVRNLLTKESTDLQTNTVIQVEGNTAIILEVILPK